MHNLRFPGWLDIHQNIQLAMGSYISGIRTEITMWFLNLEYWCEGHTRINLKLM